MEGICIFYFQYILQMAVAAIAISAINGAKAVVHACQSAKTLQRVLEGRKHKNGSKGDYHGGYGDENADRHGGSERTWVGG